MNLSNGSNHFPIPQKGGHSGIGVRVRNALLGPGAPTEGTEGVRLLTSLPCATLESNRNKETVDKTISQHPTVPSLLKAQHKTTTNTL